MSNGDPSTAQGLDVVATAVPAVAPPGVPATSPPQQYMVARVGSFLLDRCNNDTPEEVLAKLAHALDEDPRVTSVTVPVTDPKWNRSPRYYPYNHDPHNDALLKGTDVFRGLVLSEPLLFSVNVPKKNQDLLASDDEAPSEVYHAVWDGSTMVVGWEQDHDMLQLTGGQIVADVVHDAAHEAGHDLFIQSCNPDCDWHFVHSTLLITANPAVAERKVTPLRPGGNDLAVLLPEPWDPEDITEEVYHWLRGPIEAFAEMRNLGQRILDVESLTRHDLDQLLAIREERAEIGTEPLGRKLKMGWAGRGWRRKSERLVARVWLELTVLERLKRLWQQQKLDFEAIAESDSDTTLLLLNRDTRDVALIESLDMSIIESGLEQAASRLDNKAVIQTTAWATLAGAVGGGIVSALL